MENKVIEKQKKILLDSLTPTQKNYLEAMDWFYNGPRGSGRTYLSCVTAILGLLNGNRDVFILDHSPMHLRYSSYVKDMLINIANKIELPIAVKDSYGGILVTLDPMREIIEYETERKKSERKSQR